MTGAIKLNMEIGKTGLRKHEFANKCGLTKQSIYSYVNAQLCPTFRTCHLLAKGLEIPSQDVINWFFDENGEKRPLYEPPLAQSKDAL